MACKTFSQSAMGSIREFSSVLSTMLLALEGSEWQVVLSSLSEFISCHIPFLNLEQNVEEVVSHEDVGEVSKDAIKLLHIRSRAFQKGNACTKLFALEGSKVDLFSDLLLIISSHTRDHSIRWELWRVSNPEQHNYSCVEMVIRLKENLLTPCSLHWRREATSCIYCL